MVGDAFRQALITALLEAETKMNRLAEKRMFIIKIDFLFMQTEAHICLCVLCTSKGSKWGGCSAGCSLIYFGA